MTRELHCRDVGFDCDATVMAASDDEVLSQAAQHARSVHGLTDAQVSDPQFAAAVREQIHDQA